MSLLDVPRLRRLVERHARSLADVRRPVENWEAPAATGDTTVVAGAACLIRTVPVQPTDRPLPGQQYASVTTWRITFVGRLDVRSRDRIVERVNGLDARTFEVVGTLSPQTYDVCTDVVCVEVRS